MNTFDRKKQRYDKRLERTKQRKEIFDRKAEIRTVKKSMRRFKLPTTTKILMAYIFINCTVVEIYSMAAMWHVGDLSALYTLITAVVGETVSFAVYAAKSYNETKQEEIIKLERDKMVQDTEPDREGAMG